MYRQTGGSIGDLIASPGVQNVGEYLLRSGQNDPRAYEAFQPSAEQLSARKQKLKDDRAAADDVKELTAIGQTIALTMEAMPLAAKAFEVHKQSVYAANKAYGVASLIPAVNAEAIGKTRDLAITEFVQKQIGSNS